MPGLSTDPLRLTWAEPPRCNTGGTTMTRTSKVIIGTATLWLAMVGGWMVSAQDKYSVAVPGGLAFSEFKGYEAWQTIAISRNERVMAVILGNPAMIEAYQ